MNSKKVIVFGCGSDAERQLECPKENETLVCFADNDERKQREGFHGYDVIPPRKLQEIAFDAVRIASLGATTRIREQLLSLGVSEEKISPTPLWNKENLDRWEALRGKHKGERVLVIGNGPSLTTEDLQTLHENGTTCFAFNKIYLAFEQTDFRPDYYLVEDTLVAQNNAKRINDLEGVYRLYPEFLSRWLKLTEDTAVFGLNVPEKTSSFTNFSIDHTKIGWGSSVICSAIQIAIIMGFSELCLLGVDFKFVTPAENQSSRDKVLIGKGETNHFHPDYRPIGESWNPPKLEVTEAALTHGREFAKDLGVKIVNATRGGELEVFPRESLEEVLLREPETSRQ